LLYSDLSLKGWITPELTLGEKTEWINITNECPRAMAIYGVSQLSLHPIVSNMEIWVGGNKIIDHDLDALYGVLPVMERVDELDPEFVVRRFGEMHKIRMEAYFESPIIVHPDTILRVSLSPWISGPGDRLFLKGTVVEIKGVTIN
jgi:hypothetical protein